LATQGRHRDNDHLRGQPDQKAGLDRGRAPVLAPQTTFHIRGQQIQGSIKLGHGNSSGFGAIGAEWFMQITCGETTRIRNASKDWPDECHPTTKSDDSGH
jgi:hypothetical protein